MLLNAAGNCVGELRRRNRRQALQSSSAALSWPNPPKGLETKVNNPFLNQGSPKERKKEKREGDGLTPDLCFSHSFGRTGANVSDYSVQATSEVVYISLCCVVMVGL